MNSTGLSNVTVALPSGAGFGWGRCGEELTKRLVSMGAVAVEPSVLGILRRPGTVLQAIGGHDFSYTKAVMGKEQIGYGFIENNLLAEKFYPLADRLWDCVISGSTWMHRNTGERSIGVVIQGVNPEEFHYSEAESEPRFTIGSFGKFEYRKGQDVVIKAVSLFLQRHKDVVLQTAWGNLWPQTAASMSEAQDSYVKVPSFLSFGSANFTHGAAFGAIMIEAGIPMENFEVPLGMGSTQDMMSLYSRCDVALFPNRCEAGTNLCLHEALACGVPCIVTDATGHTDITRHKDYPCDDLLLEGGKSYIHKVGDVEIGEWHQPCLEEVLSQLEYAYRNRDELRSRRKQIAEFGSGFTWDKSAEQMAKLLKGWDL